LIAPVLTWEIEMDGHVGSAPTIPVWKTSVYLSTPMPEEKWLGERSLESRAGIARAFWWPCASTFAGRHL